MALFLSIFCFRNKVYSQDEDCQLKLGLRLAPIALIDFYNGSSYRGGVEFSLTNRISIYTDIGGYFKNFNVLRNISGFNIDGGIKYYIKNKIKEKQLYLSISHFYKEQAFDFTDSLRNPPISFSYRTRKYVSSTCLNLGVLIQGSSRFYLDALVGLGLRYKNVLSSADYDDMANGLQYGDSQSLYFLVTPGRYIYPQLNLRFRLGFRLS